MDSYSTLILGLLALAVVTVLAMLIGRASRRNLRQPDVANDTRHADSFITESGSVVHLEDVSEEKY